MSLPSEILLQILDRNKWNDLKTLLNCCLVNSSWLKVAQPLLFRHLGIYGRGVEESSLHNLLRSIDGRPELASFIHFLQLQHLTRFNLKTLTREEKQCIASLLSKLTNVKSINWDQVEYSQLSKEIQQSINGLFRLPSLVSLEIRSSTHPSALDFLLAISGAANLQTLHISRFRFDQIHDTRISSPDEILSPPDSIPLTALGLNHTDISSFVELFSDVTCPFSFRSLDTLYLVCSSWYPPDTPDCNTLDVLLELIGPNIKHFTFQLSHGAMTIRH
ncbi:hypothetical protein V5O48_014249 [Marasmius crinis-equi]|uniref:F-box domain-containing protein n=1 Tax=Marasmius crinis-equi TaxID=585013 RepID=A0ABR3EXU6_9AGAR